MSRRGIVLSALLLASAGTAASADVLKINTVNYAGVEASLLRIAEQAATQILSQAGVGVQWCEASTGRFRSRCPADALRLVILPRHMRERLKLARNEALGMALMTMDGLTGDTAYIFMDRIENLVFEDTAGRRSILARLLGHVMVHEVGHLLLGAGNHRLRSIMTPIWGPAEVQGALQGGLLFGPEHVERISEFLCERSADGGS
ncbi:MAG: hypothetical protein SGI92_20480 [Bryobacteraceae bacterium]|nr:hypothetical protein [Bryobacteraceae bacterium]